MVAPSPVPKPLRRDRVIGRVVEDESPELALALQEQAHQSSVDDCDPTPPP